MTSNILNAKRRRQQRTVLARAANQGYEETVPFLTAAPPTSFRTPTHDHHTASQ